mgnify:CR=1 FL=1
MLKQFRGSFALSIYSLDQHPAIHVLDYKRDGKWIDNGERDGHNLIVRYEGITQHHAAEITWATSGLENITSKIDEINNIILLRPAA